MSPGLASILAAVAGLACLSAFVASWMQRLEPGRGHAEAARRLLGFAAFVQAFALVLDLRAVGVFTDLWGTSITQALVLRAAAVSTLAAAAWAVRPPLDIEPPMDRSIAGLLMGLASVIGGLLILVSWEGNARVTPGFGVLDLTFMMAGGLLVVPFLHAVGFLGRGYPGWQAASLPTTRVALVLGWASVVGLALTSNESLASPGRAFHLVALTTWIVLVHALLYARKRRFLVRTAVASSLFAFPFSTLGLVAFDSMMLREAALITGVWAAIAVGGAFLRNGEPPKDSPEATFFVMGRLVAWGMFVLVAGSMAWIAIAVQGWTVAPATVSAAVVIPLLAILAVALSNQAWGLPVSLGAVAVAVGVGAAWTMGTGLSPTTGITVCMGVVATAAAFTKTFKSSDPGPGVVGSHRVSGAILLAGGVWCFLDYKGQFLWNPLSFVLTDWPLIALVVRALLALVAISAAIHAVRGRGRGWAVTGCLALAVALTPLLGLALLVDFVGRREDKEPPRPGGLDVSGLRKEHRKTAVYLVHVGIVVALVGWVAQASDGLGVGPGEAASWLARGGALLVGVGLALLPLLQDPKPAARDPTMAAA